MTSKFQIFFLLLAGLTLYACIGDDYIDDEIEPTIVISNPIAQLQIGSTHDFEYSYFNNIGVEEEVDNVIWSSSNPDIISIDENGVVNALVAGFSTISAELNTQGNVIFDEIILESTEMPVDNPDLTKGGMIMTTSSYQLEGTFTITANEGDLIIEFENDYEASTALPGLYVYLTNNPNTISNAYEIGAVTVFSGSHSYEVQDIGINDYQYLLYFCKPFNVKVGDGKID